MHHAVLSQRKWPSGRSHIHTASPQERTALYLHLGHPDPPLPGIPRLPSSTCSSSTGVGTVVFMVANPWKPGPDWKPRHAECASWGTQLGSMNCQARRRSGGLGESPWGCWFRMEPSHHHPGPWNSCRFQERLSEFPTSSGR